MFLNRLAWTLSVIVLICSATTLIVNSFRVQDDTGLASDKFNSFWATITGQGTGKNSAWPTTFQLLNLFIESDSPTMDTVSDTMPSGRQKLIHSVGAAAQFSFNWNQAAISNLGYTGLFAGASADYGIVRISGAVKWDLSKAPIAGSFTPGMGIKVFRSGVPSGNFVAMNRLTPQESWNPFKHTWSNHVSGNNLTTELDLLSAKFGTVSSWANQVGLSDLASYDQNGNAISSPVFPWQLFFMPNPTLQNNAAYEVAQDLPTRLVQIPNPVGLTLFTVYALNNPLDATAVQIGTMVLKTPFEISTGTDSTFFIKHQKMEDDLQYRADWLKTCPNKYACKVCPYDRDCGVGL